MPASDFLRYQLGLIKNAFINNCTIMGDFNIVASKNFSFDFRNKNLYSDLEEILGSTAALLLVDT